MTPITAPGRPTPGRSTPGPHLVLPILAAQAAAIAPHAFGMPLWINGWCLAMWGVLLLRSQTGRSLPPAWVRRLLTAIGITGLLVTYRLHLGSDAFVGLMALMAAIKPFEMTNHRHCMITILLTYFITITSLFRSDAIWTLLYMFFSVFVTTVALVRINHPEGELKQGIGLAGRILAQAIPLMILLFLLFPRLQDEVFGVRDPMTGKTGFSEELKPGSVSSLARDPSLAFRAGFDGPLPPADALYWRGIVFDTFNGLTWRPADPPMPAGLPPASHGSLYPHTIFLEAHKSRWLITLDRPTAPPPGAFITVSGAIRSYAPVRRKKTYRAVSSLVPAGPGSRAPRPIPVGIRNNPRTRALAMTLTKDLETAPAKLQNILAYFRGQGFTYTLTPEPAFKNPIDHFMFDSRSGYCEHYASALAFMMNQAGVPARVVGGYLGGELNPYGNYITVTQSLAHAWVEVYLPEQGWTRTDPTLVVAPERISRFPDGSAAFGAGGLVRASMFKKMKFFLEAVNLRWEEWFTGYAFFGQQAILKRLGLARGMGALGIGLILAGLCLGVLAAFAVVFLWINRSGAPRPDPAAQAYGRFCQKLDRIGIRRLPSQGPRDFARAIGKERPDLAARVKEIVDLYVRLRFRSPEIGNSPGSAGELARLVKQFNPGKHPKKRI